MDYRKNAPLIAAIAIPLLMIIFVAASIYLPGLFKQPKYSFLYADGYTSGFYQVQNGTLGKAINKNSDETPFYKDVKIYFYDMAQQRSKEISFNDASKLQLDNNRISLDGFVIEQGRHTRLFDSSDYSDLYAVSGSVSKKLNTTIRNYEFTFLGWVK